MKRIIIFALSAMLLSGCGVSKMKVHNWKPDDNSRATTFYECLQQAQQVESRAGFAANQYGAAGSARTGAVTNKDILVACMNAKGYQLRNMTVTESVIRSRQVMFAILINESIDIFRLCCLS